MYKRKITRSTTPPGGIPSIRNLSRIVSRSLSFRKRMDVVKIKNAVDDTSTICEESSVDCCSSTELHSTSKISRPDILLKNAALIDDGISTRSDIRESDSRDILRRNNLPGRLTVDRKATFDDMLIAFGDSFVTGCSSIDVESTVSGKTT